MPLRVTRGAPRASKAGSHYLTDMTTYSLARFRIAALALTSSWVLATAAQGPISVAASDMTPIHTELRSMSEGSFNAFTTTIVGADKRLAAGEYKALMKEYGAKSRRSKPEALRTEAVVVRSIGGNDPVDVYVDFDERGDDVLVRMWVRQRGEFIGAVSGVRDRAATEDLLTEYALRVRRAAVQRELDAELKEMGRIEKRMAQVERDIARAERDIVQARAAIERAEAAIVRAEGQIEDGQAATVETQGEMAAQAEAVEAVREKLASVGSVAAEGG